MIVITPATAADLPRLTELENRIFVSDRISVRQFRYLLTKANAIFLKAEQADELLGYMVLLKRRTSRRLRIYSIGVADSARKQGIARRLIACAEQLAREHHKAVITLEVCEKNEAAVRLYLDSGFSLFGRKAGYYEDGCSALLLRKKIIVPVTDN